MARKAVPTERDRFWLDHERALARSGRTAKAYAAEHGLSLHAFYQARKRLRTLGLLGAGGPRRPRPGKSPKKTAARPVSFSKVEIRSPRPSPTGFRLSLSGGAVLEWSGETLPPAVLELVERLSPSR